MDEKTGVARFSVSMPANVLDDFDAATARQGYTNRSQAITDLVQAHLLEQQQQGDGTMAGVITLVYDHHKRHLQELLTEIQHGHEHLIVATLHVHLDHDNCLEAIVVRGPATELKGIADVLIAAKGVSHGKLTITSVAGEAGHHRHD